MYQRLELHLLFVDEHGDAIEAATDVHSSAHFNELIRPKACYRITGFVCIEARTSSRVVDRDAMILFGRSTTVIPIESNTIPVYYFSFASYSALHTRMLDKNKVLTDFIGRYIDAKEIPNHTKKGLLRVKQQDESLNSGKMIEVALWEEVAVGFNQKAAKSNPDPSIIAVTSLKVSTFGGALQLASTSAFETYINPCISQLPALIQRFKHIPAYEIPSPPTRNQFVESNLTLLLEIIYETKKETTYTCLSRITEIQCGEGKGWFYESCIKCTNKAYQSGHQYYCPSHGFRDEHLYCYRFTGTIADDSCTADAVFFDSIVTSLVGTTCYDMVVTQQNNDPKILPAPLKHQINNPYIFEIQAKNDNQNEAIGVNKAHEAPSSPTATPTVPTRTTSSSAATPTSPSVKTQKEHVNKNIARNKRPKNSKDAHLCIQVHLLKLRVINYNIKTSSSTHVLHQLPDPYNNTQRTGQTTACAHPFSIRIRFCNTTICNGNMQVAGYFENHVT